MFDQEMTRFVANRLLPALEDWDVGKTQAGTKVRKRLAGKVTPETAADAGILDQQLYDAPRDGEPFADDSGDDVPEREADAAPATRS